MDFSEHAKSEQKEFNQSIKHQNQKTMSFNELVRRQKSIADQPNKETRKSLLARINDKAFWFFYAYATRAN